MAESLTLPLCGVIGSIIFFGTFAVPMKAKSIREVKLHPIVFQVYVAFGVCVSSLPIMAMSNWSPDRFTCWGFLSAFMWTFCNMLCVLTVDLLGVSVGQGMWSGAVALVSFIDGLICGQKLDNPILAVAGLLLLIAGILGLAISSGGETSELQEQLASEDGLVASASHSQRDGSSKQRAGAGSVARKMRGAILAACIGILAGSLFVPLNQLTDLRGIDQLLYSVPFGVGCVLSAFVLLVGHTMARCVGMAEPLAWEPRRCFLPALVSGVLWNAGNICSILAQLPHLGMGIGYPLTQRCILVSGIWGIAYWKEITGRRAIIIFFAFALVLLAGAALLGVFGV